MRKSSLTLVPSHMGNTEHAVHSLATMPAPKAIPRRPRRRGRRPRTYAAVLAATTELLETTSLAELSVAEILEAAGVGRTSFYEHFSSKEDVLIKLVRGISAEVADEIEPMFERGERSPDEAFALGLGNLVDTASRSAALVAAVSAEWPTIPELKEIWFEMLGDFTARLARMIESERAGGAAPEGADARALAASLVWTAERSFHVAVGGDHPTLVNVQAVVEPLVQLFVGTIYGRPVRT
jgi:AcrR family transcriptional regulator